MWCVLIRKTAESCRRVHANRPLSGARGTASVVGEHARERARAVERAMISTTVDDRTGLPPAISRGSAGTTPAARRARDGSPRALLSWLPADREATSIASAAAVPPGSNARPRTPASTSVSTIPPSSRSASSAARGWITFRRWSRSAAGRRRSAITTTREACALAS